MEDAVIDVSAEEIIENNTLEDTPDMESIKAKINQKELKKVIKQYKRYRRSIFAEIRRIDNQNVES